MWARQGLTAAADSALLQRAKLNSPAAVFVPAGGWRARRGLRNLPAVLRCQLTLDQTNSAQKEHSVH